MDSRSVGLLVIGLGVVAIIVGLLVMTGTLGWFGRLPGDIRVEREGMRMYVPLVSMIVLSIVLTIVVNLLRRFW